MFLVSMADIIGSYERLPNDAVRAVAVAKRREYIYTFHADLFQPQHQCSQAPIGLIPLDLASLARFVHLQMFLMS